jgi:hypothetical protein
LTSRISFSIGKPWFLDACIPEENRFFTIRVWLMAAARSCWLSCWLAWQAYERGAGRKWKPSFWSWRWRCCRQAFSCYSAFASGVVPTSSVICRPWASLSPPQRRS